MKPIFTIHAGEYLVGEELERLYPECEIWIPSKDTGTDLLVTNGKDRNKNASIQVKFSKDFLPSMKSNFHPHLLACGWWTLDLEKMQKSNAEFWILAPYSFHERKTHFIVISPRLLSEMLIKIHGNSNKCNVYLWITKNGEKENGCYETRGLNRNLIQEITINNHKNIPEERDFSKYLNNWSPITAKLA